MGAREVGGERSGVLVTLRLQHTHGRKARPIGAALSVMLDGAYGLSDVRLGDCSTTFAHGRMEAV